MSWAEVVKAAMDIPAKKRARVASLFEAISEVCLEAANEIKDKSISQFRVAQLRKFVEDLGKVATDQVVARLRLFDAWAETVTAVAAVDWKSSDAAEAAVSAARNLEQRAGEFSALAECLRAA